MPKEYAAGERTAINRERGIIVDLQDEWLLEWRLWAIHHMGYPITHIRDGPINMMCYLHHYIVGYPLFGVVDHIDRNTLNNRRSNLRYISSRGNRMNSIIGDNPTHHIRVRANGTYNVRMYIDGKYWSATFDTLDEAIAERNAWANQQRNE